MQRSALGAYERERGHMGEREREAGFGLHMGRVCEVRGGVWSHMGGVRGYPRESPHTYNTSYSYSTPHPAAYLAYFKSPPRPRVSRVEAGGGGGGIRGSRGLRGG